MLLLLNVCLLDHEYLSSSQLEKYKSGIRLKTMVEYLDGFKVAEVDMKLRGPGDIFGTRQSGFPEFRYINLIEDTELLISAKETAFRIIGEDPHLAKNRTRSSKKFFLQIIQNSCSI